MESTRLWWPGCAGRPCGSRRWQSCRWRGWSRCCSSRARRRCRRGAAACGSRRRPARRRRRRAASRGRRRAGWRRAPASPGAPAAAASCAASGERPGRPSSRWRRPARPPTRFAPPRPRTDSAPLWWASRGAGRGSVWWATRRSAPSPTALPRLVPSPGSPRRSAAAAHTTCGWSAAVWGRCWSATPAPRRPRRHRSDSVVVQRWTRLLYR